jgi:hypothetical protein
MNLYIVNNISSSQNLKRKKRKQIIHKERGSIILKTRLHIFCVYEDEIIIKFNTEWEANKCYLCSRPQFKNIQELRSKIFPQKNFIIKIYFLLYK